MEAKHDEAEIPEKVSEAATPEPARSAGDAPKLSEKSSKLVIPDITLYDLKDFMQFPSSILLIGKKFSGKTNLLRSLIDRKKFDNVFIITLSGHTGNLTKLASDKQNVLEGINDQIIQFILDFQVENKKSKCCIIFDDFIDSERTLRAVPKIMQLATSGRNFNITLVISSQTISAIPTACRRNVEYLFIGKNMMSSAEILSREYATAQIGIKELKQEIINITDHSWLLYNERVGAWVKLPESEIKVVV
jgi:hypothetical protein